MTIRVRIASLVNTMLMHQQKELSLAKGSACNCSCPMYKPTSHTIITKVLWIASWVPMHSLPWAQHKKWIPIRSIGCVHTHWGRLAIEGCASPSHIQSVVEKIGEDNWKVEKIGWIINQAPTLVPKHDKIWAWWVSSISLENMLMTVWWCKRSKMESWNEPFTVW
jgi:GH43 family beta-xylosidase